jgi:hypothetical protein
MFGYINTYTTINNIKGGIIDFLIINNGVPSALDHSNM